MSKTFSILFGLLVTAASAVGQGPLKLYEGQPQSVSVSSDEDLDYEWKSYLVTGTPFTIDNATPTAEASSYSIDDVTAQNANVVFHEAGTYILKVDGKRKDDACMNTKAMAFEVVANNFFAYFDPTVGAECAPMGNLYTITASLRFAERTTAMVDGEKQIMNDAMKLNDIDNFFPVMAKASYRVRSSADEPYSAWQNIDGLQAFNSATEPLSFTVDESQILVDGEPIDLNNGAEIQLRLDEAKTNLQFALHLNNDVDSDDIDSQDAVFRYQYFALPVKPDFDLALTRK